MLAALHLLTRIRDLVVDPGSREIVYRSGWVVPLKRDRYSVDDVNTVELRTKYVKRGKEKKALFELVLKGKKRHVVCRLPGFWFARAVGEKLAIAIDRPLVDKVTGKGERREAKYLEESIFQRWRRERRVFERPSLPQPTKLRVEEGPERFSVTFPAQFPEWWPVTLFLFAWSVPALIDTPANEFFHTAQYRLVSFLVFCMGFMSLALVGRSQVTITPTKISVRQGMLPLKHKLDLNEIEQWVVEFDGISLIGDERMAFIEWAGNKADSDYLEAAVAHHLQRLAAESDRSSRLPRFRQE